MTPRYEIDIHVDPGVAFPATIDGVDAAIRHVLRLEAVSEAELSIAFVDDQRMAALNREYLAQQGPTDVIAFALTRPGGPVVGDIYVGAQQAERQAAELGVTLDVELLRLVIHGALHVLGFDHPEGEEREHSPMYARQEEMLAAILKKEE
jgi:probable rRNA maturation factor